MCARVRVYVCVCALPTPREFLVDLAALLKLALNLVRHGPAFTCMCVFVCIL